MTCRCHADSVYAGLIDCPACGHRSFDPICRACERRRCSYEEARDLLGPPATEQETR